MYFLSHAPSSLSLPGPSEECSLVSLAVTGRFRDMFALGEIDDIGLFGVLATDRATFTRNHENDYINKLL